jgi:hypothetical protein
MFSLCAQAPQLKEAELVYLCASLNAPVLNIGSLPRGPARAAIALHAETAPDGSRVPQLTIGLRALDSGQIAVYQYAGEVRKLGSAPRAVDSALSFAEEMGFLFDDDLVAGAGGRTRALKLWHKLVGCEDGPWDSDPDISEVVKLADLEPETAALMRDGSDLGEPLLQAELQPEPQRVPPVEVRGGSERRSAQPRRWRDSDDAPEAQESGASGTLGRVPLVRMRVQADGVDDDQSETLRLLASF